MSATLTNRHVSTLPVRAEKCAKADLRKAEMDDYRQRVGSAVERARHLRGWTNDELAGAVGRDPRQVARWQSGDERPHFDALLAVDDDRFRNALVAAFAELGAGVVIDTVIHIPLKALA